MVWIEDGDRLGLEQAVDAPALHGVDADQAGEGERRFDRALSRLGQPQQQEGPGAALIWRSASRLLSSFPQTSWVTSIEL